MQSSLCPACEHRLSHDARYLLAYQPARTALKRAR